MKKDDERHDLKPGIYCGEKGTEINATVREAQKVRCRRRRGKWKQESSI